MSAPVKVGRLTLRPHIRSGRESGQWQIDIPARFTLSGKRERRSCPSLEEARQEAARLLLEIQRRGSIKRKAVMEGIDEAALTVRALAEQWIKHQETRVAAGKKKESSLHTNCYQLVPLLERLGSVTLDRLSPEHLEAYQAGRRSAGVRPPSINSELSTLSQIQRWATTQGLMSRVVKTDPVPVVREYAPVLDGDEAQRLLDALPQRVRPLVWLLAETGCRFSEATHLRLIDIDFQQGIAWIRHREDWTPKTLGSARELYLSEALCEAIRALERSDGCEFVFEGRAPGKPIDDIRRSFKKAVETAGIRRNGEIVDFRPKDLRANFATWVARSGTRERVLQHMIGHVPGSRVTKTHYERATREDHVEAVDRLRSRYRLGTSDLVESR